VATGAVVRRVFLKTISFYKKENTKDYLERYPQRREGRGGVKFSYLKKLYLIFLILT